jgi:broad specificity phosphatase PhoE
MGTIHLVRHGQASFGAADYDRLSELGHTQSRRLGDWAREVELGGDTIVCGPARRHVETADDFIECFGGAEIERRVDAGFAEFDHLDVLEKYHAGYGDVANLARVLAEAPEPRRAFEGIFRAAIARWTDSKFAADYAEPYAAFVARCEAGFARVCTMAGGERNVWVFTSGGPISASIRRVLALSETHTWELNSALVNTSVTTFRTRGERARLDTFNSTAHLRGARPSFDGLITYR